MGDRREYQLTVFKSTSDGPTGDTSALLRFKNRPVSFGDAPAFVKVPAGIK